MKKRNMILVISLCLVGAILTACGRNQISNDKKDEEYHTQNSETSITTENNAQISENEPSEEKGINNKDYILNEIVVFPDDEYDEEKAQWLVENIKDIDLKFFQSMYLRGSKIVFVNDDNPDVYWWETVPEIGQLSITDAAGLYSGNTAYIAFRNASKEKEDEEFYNLRKNFELSNLYHEIGHLIDLGLASSRTITDYLYSTDQFEEIIENEWKFFVYNEAPYPSPEYFAFAFQKYYSKDQDDYNFLKETTPLTFEFIENVLNNSYIDEYGNVLLE